MYEFTTTQTKVHSTFFCSVEYGTSVGGSSRVAVPVPRKPYFAQKVGSVYNHCFHVKQKHEWRRKSSSEFPFLREKPLSLFGNARGKIFLFLLLLLPPHD